jgi:hypothetical protein
VRHTQAVRRQCLAAVEQQVDVDRARRPTAAVDATELALDGFEPVEDVRRRRLRVAMGDEVQEWLIPVGGRIVGQHRRRFDDGRNADELHAARGEPLESSREMGATVAHVRAEPEINVNHGYSYNP